MNMFRYEFACNVFDAKTSPTNVETSMITACSNAKTELEYYNKEQQLAHFPTNNVACYVNLLGGINWIIPHYYNVWFIKREKGFLDIIVTSRLMISFVIFDDEQIIKNHRWKRFIVSTIPPFKITNNFNSPRIFVVFLLFNYFFEALSTFELHKENIRTISLIINDTKNYYLSMIISRSKLFIYYASNNFHVFDINEDISMLFEW